MRTPREISMEIQALSKILVRNSELKRSEIWKPELSPKEESEIIDSIGELKEELSIAIFSQQNGLILEEQIPDEQIAISERPLFSALKEEPDCLTNQLIKLREHLKILLGATENLFSLNQIPFEDILRLLADFTSAVRQQVELEKVRRLNPGVKEIDHRSDALGNVLMQKVIINEIWEIPEHTLEFLESMEEHLLLILNRKQFTPKIAQNFIYTEVGLREIAQNQILGKRIPSDKHEDRDLAELPSLEEYAKVPSLDWVEDRNLDEEDLDIMLGIESLEVWSKFVDPDEPEYLDRDSTYSTRHFL